MLPGLVALDVRDGLTGDSIVNRYPIVRATVLVDLSYLMLLEDSQVRWSDHSSSFFIGENQMS